MICTKFCPVKFHDDVGILDDCLNMPKNPLSQKLLLFLNLSSQNNAGKTKAVSSNFLEGVTNEGRLYY